MRLAAQIRSGAVSPIEAVESSLERIEAHPGLNAFVTVAAAMARKFARETAPHLIGVHPLAGVPVAHKDIFSTRGIRTTGGSRSRLGMDSAVDSKVVAALRTHGMPLVGKTNTHELATGVTGEVSAAGRVANPWAAERMAGGSSSGSAAAVAAGLVPLATATDTGGSARIPAACCGVVGFKPTNGTLSTRGVVPFSWTLDHVGFIARSTADVVLAMAAAGGWSLRSTSPVEDGLSGLRFAIPAALLADATAEVSGQIVAVGAALEALGARRVEPPWPDVFSYADGIAAAIFLREGGAVHAATLAEAPNSLEAPTYELLSTSRQISNDTYRRALAARRAAISAADRYFAQTDLLLTPTIPSVAPPGNARNVQLPCGAVDVRAALTRFTRLWNVCGNPSVSVPCGLEGGLPVGAQLISSRGRDGLLLAASSAYEAHRGRFPLPPDFID